jgi:DNA polymerase III delta prime subunit
MKPPLLHPKTQKLLAALLEDLPQALIVTGKVGTGTFEVATHIAQTLGAHEEVLLPKKKSKDGKKFDVDIENGRVVTEDIRSLYDSVRGKQTSPRVFIIRKADRLMPNAQNALLKLLEEPSKNVYFILETYNSEALFATIRSRTQTLDVLPITAEQTNALIKDLGITDATRRIQLKFIAEGLPAELQKLVENEEYFNIRAERMNDARQFLQSNAYDKLLIIQKYQTSRENTLQLLDSALHITRHTVVNNPQHALITQLNSLLTLKEKIAGNQNTRLQMTEFALG